MKSTLKTFISGANQTFLITYAFSTKTGMAKLRVSAQTRWATRTNGADKLDLDGRLLAAAVSHIYGNGSMSVKSDLANSIFSEKGMEDAKRVRFARLPGQAFYFLTSPSSTFANALVAFANRLMVRPLSPGPAAALVQHGS